MATTRDNSWAAGERLYTIRSNAGLQTQWDKNNRGEIAKIQLMSTDPSSTAERIRRESTGSPSFLGSSVDQLLSSSGFTNFLLTDVQFSMQEKVQVMPVFGDSEVVYYFGRHPMQMTISGMIFDSPDNNWFVQFMQTYEAILRGTKLAKNYEILKITLPNAIIIGSISGISYSQNAQRDVDIPFTMSILVKQYIPKVQMPESRRSTSDGNSLFSIYKAGNLQVSSSTEAINKIKAKLGRGSFGGIESLKGENVPGMFGSVGSTLGDWQSKVSSGIGSLNNAVNDLKWGLYSAEKPVLDALASVRGQLISPVFGIVSSISKVVKTAGTSMGILGQISAPIKSLLNEVTSTYAAGAAIVSEVQSTVSALKSLPGTSEDYINKMFDNASDKIKQVNKQVGSISHYPISGTTILAARLSSNSSNAARLGLGNSSNAKTSAVLSVLNNTAKKARSNTL